MNKIFYLIDGDSDYFYIDGTEPVDDDVRCHECFHETVWIGDLEMWVCERCLLYWSICTDLEEGTLYTSDGFLVKKPEEIFDDDENLKTGS